MLFVTLEQVEHLLVLVEEAQNRYDGTSRLARPWRARSAILAEMLRNERWRMEGGEYSTMAAKKKAVAKPSKPVGKKVKR